MEKVAIVLIVEISDEIADTTDNGITLTVEQAVGQITGYHNPEVVDIDRRE